MLSFFLFFCFNDHVTPAFCIFFRFPVSQLLSPQYSSLGGVQRTSPKIPPRPETVGATERAQSQVFPLIGAVGFDQVRPGKGMESYLTETFPTTFSFFHRSARALA